MKNNKMLIIIGGIIVAILIVVAIFLPPEKEEEVKDKKIKEDIKCTKWCSREAYYDDYGDI